MKTAKYIIIGAMMTVISVPTMAQDATSAIEQATKIIKSGAEDKDKQVTAVFKTVKKDAKAIAGIGRAYLNAKEFDNADKYADLAIKANKNCGELMRGRAALLVQLQVGLRMQIPWIHKIQKVIVAMLRLTQRQTQTVLSQSLSSSVLLTLLILLTLLLLRFSQRQAEQMLQ